MTMVALIMRSWIMEMRTHIGITCYSLADDVLIIGTGLKMVSKFAKAFNATHLYLHKMGAKVAPDIKLQLCQLQQGKKMAQEHSMETY